MVLHVSACRDWLFPWRSVSSWESMAFCLHALSVKMSSFSVCSKTMTWQEMTWTGKCSIQTKQEFMVWLRPNVFSFTRVKFPLFLICKEILDVENFKTQEADKISALWDHLSPNTGIYFIYLLTVFFFNSALIYSLLFLFFHHPHGQIKTSLYLNYVSSLFRATFIAQQMHRMLTFQFGLFSVSIFSSFQLCHLSHNLSVWMWKMSENSLMQNGI